MNVFEFLGMTHGHRPKNKVVQLVKHYDEVPDSRKQYPYIGQVKKDGVFAMLVSYHGRQAIFSRTGEMLTNCEVILLNPEVQMLNDGVYIGELLSHHKCSLEQLSGTISSERVNALEEIQLPIAANLYIAWHDFLPIGSFKQGSANANYEQRYARLCQELADLDIEDDILSYVIIHDEAAKDRFTRACIASDEEGACYKHMGAGWIAGHKGWHVMKEVRGVSYDLECVGYEEGEGKYAGKVANLVFRWKDGKTIKAMLGKGWTHADAELMFCACDSGSYLHPSYPLGKIFKVTALQESSKGKLRLPKVRELRTDKHEPDY